MSPAVPTPAGAVRAAVTGIGASAVALGAGELAAGLVGHDSSPVLAVGAAAIDLSPRATTEFAIRTFGSNDKLVLLVGLLLVVAALGALLGVLAARRRRIGIAGLLVFGAVGVAAAVSRPGAALVAAVPSVVAAGAGIAALILLLRQLPTAAPAGGGRNAPARQAEAELERRRFVLAAGAAAGVAMVTAGGGTLVRRSRDVAQARDQLLVPAAAAPNVEPAPIAAPQGFADIEGLSPLLTPNDAFYRIDTALRVPQIDPAGWSLRIHGRVDRELRLTFADLAGRDDLFEADISLACVSNEVGGSLAGGARWVGVPLAALLAEAGVEAGADQVLTRSMDGWSCGTPTADCQQTPNAMLALSMNGEPLPLEHGFPVRMIVPGLYGYVSATKWIVDMELTTFAEAAGYWIQRGWDAIAPIQVFSRIDVPRTDRAAPAGPVTIAGVAHSGSAGIEAVQVRIDDQPWVAGELSPGTNTQLWRQWKLPWAATRGQHDISVRAVDGTGRTQSDEEYPPYPNASSGWHSIRVDVG